jgi:hypothetical protein
MFHVEWLQSALDELAAIWLQADSAERKAISAASHVLEARLQHDPRSEGESRSKGRRITFISPLAATFRLEDDGRTVTILHVRMFRRRRP